MSTQTLLNFGTPDLGAFHSYLSVDPNDLLLFDPGPMKDSMRNNGGFSENQMEGLRSYRPVAQQSDQATSITPTDLRPPISIRTGNIAASQQMRGPAMSSGGLAFARQYEVAMSSGQVDRGVTGSRPGINSARRRMG